VFIFRPDTQQMDTLIFKGETNAEHLFTSAGVFVDGVIPYDKDLYLRQYIFYTQKTSLNSIDFLRLWLFQKSTKQNQGKTVVFTLPLSQSANTALSKMLTDKTLYQEGKTISIVNASTFYGKGSSIAAAFISMGVNVISVTTANSQENTSYISYLGNSTYTLQKLSRITHIPIIYSQNNGRLADITVVIGEDIQD